MMLPFSQVCWNACNGLFLPSYSEYDSDTEGQTVLQFSQSVQRTSRAQYIAENYKDFAYLKKTGYKYLSWKDKRKYENGEDLHSLMRHSEFFTGSQSKSTTREILNLDSDNSEDDAQQQDDADEDEQSENQEDADNQSDEDDEGDEDEEEEEEEEDDEDSDGDNRSIQSKKKHQDDDDDDDADGNNDFQMNDLNTVAQGPQQSLCLYIFYISFISVSFIFIIST